MTLELIVEKFLRDNEEAVTGPPVTDEQLDGIINNLDKDETNVTLDLLPEDYKNFMRKYGYIGAHPMHISGRGMSTSCKVKFFYLIYQRLFMGQSIRHRAMNVAQASYCWKIAEWGLFHDCRHTDYYFDLSGVEMGYVWSAKGTKKNMLYARSFTEFLEKIFEEYKMGPKEEKSPLDEFFESYRG